MAFLDFGREICGDLSAAERREWTVTNGIGGFASATVAGTLTRRYHGLLMAALKPPLGRTLLLAKLDERVEYDGIYPRSGRFYSLSTNRWASGVVEADGQKNLNRFHLEGTTPVWTYGIGNALLEKRVWMAQGENSTYIQYHLRRATGPLTLEAKAFVNYRDYHSTTIMDYWDTEFELVANGLQLRAFEGARPLYLLSDQAEMMIQSDWYEGFLLSQEEYRGQPDVEEDHIYAALLRATLREGESLTIVATTESDVSLDGTAVYEAQRAHEQALLEQAGVTDAAPAVQQLVLAADQFIVKRATAENEDGRSIIAGYPWFSDWGRDTMIALPGLTLNTGRQEEAATILRTYAQFVDQGMIPNRFPDADEEPEYNTVDATFWFFEAIRAYHAATEDDALLRDLFPVLQEIIRWHKEGTRYNIKMDEADGLIYAGETGIQLTWMDAKVDEWVVTPRIGKPVEINALWYNALCSMAAFAERLGEASEAYVALAEKVKEGFGRFWNKKMGYCFDVIDEPTIELRQTGSDGSLRPNQIFAVSLPHTPLTTDQQRSVVDACARHLYTAHGLRSLSADDPAYKGVYGGDRHKRDGAYHQGTVWSWLIGPFVQAHLRVYDDRQMARTYLLPLLHHLGDHGVGSISEIYDGNAPYTPRGCPVQAWSVAELLRAWQATEQT